MTTIERSDIRGCVHHRKAHDHRQSLTCSSLVLITEPLVGTVQQAKVREPKHECGFFLVREPQRGSRPPTKVRGTTIGPRPPTHSHPSRVKPTYSLFDQVYLLRFSYGTHSFFLNQHVLQQLTRGADAKDHIPFTNCQVI